MGPHDYFAATLCIAHTHVYDRFGITPRLVLSSPVRECGKTTLLEVLTKLVARPELFDSITAAGIYDSTDKHSTLLLDEADNLPLTAKAELRAVINSGHRRGHRIKRGKGKQAHRCDTFAPIALASIGSGLYAALVTRSITVHTTRYNGNELQRFNSDDTQDLDIAYSETRHWAHAVQLNTDPEMPPELRGRSADNWRPLV